MFNKFNNRNENNRKSKNPNHSRATGHFYSRKWVINLMSLQSNEVLNPFSLNKNFDNKKSQIATLDTIFASTIFIILIIIVFYNWNSYSLRNYESNTFNEVELLTMQLTDLMIKTPGSPNNWEANLSQPILILGLAESDRVLSKNKLTAMQNMSYNTTKTIMNIDRYEYYLLIKQENSSILELGNIPTKKSARIKRSLMYENKPVTFEFAVW